MTKQESIKLFKEKKVRTVWGEEQKKWCFSIVYIAAYWRKLKQRLLAERNETVTNCHQLK